MKQLLLSLLVLLAVPLSAQERPIAGTTLQTTDTSANSVLVGCTVGSTVCTGGIKANTITPVTTLTVAGLLSVTSFGTHTFSAGGTGGNVIAVRNTTAGTTNSASLFVGNDASANLLNMEAYSSTFTPGTYNLANGAAVFSTGVGGLSLMASHASGAIRFLTGGNTLRLNINATSLFEFYNNGSAVFATLDGTGPASFVLASSPNGTGNVTGNFLAAGKNSSGSGAAGYLQLVGLSGTYALWTDTAGNFRISSGGAPQEDGTPSDTSGTVVGTQASQRAAKNILGPFRDNTAALTAILRAPLYRFTYKNGAYNGTEFVGITTDDSPMFGMDAGRSFNPVSAFGYTVAAFKAQQARIDTLERRLRALEKKP